MTGTSNRPRQFVAREPGCTGSERIAMTEITSRVPATGCLCISGVDAGDEYASSHYPVFGLSSDLTLVIEMNGRPATSADLESWLIEAGNAGAFYAQEHDSPCAAPAVSLALDGQGSFPRTEVLTWPPRLPRPARAAQLAAAGLGSR